MKSTRRRVTVFAFACAALAAAPMATAQQSSGVTGVVVSETTGVPLVGATLVVTPSGQGAITDAEGKFTIDLPPGTYSVEVSAIGYLSAVLELEVGERQVEVDFKLPDDPRFAEVIVVVGSRTPRSITKSPVPIDIITAEQIQEVGEIETNQVLRTVAPSYNASHQTISDGTDHINPASLRGLGPDQVLLLVNGKRRHASALVNVNGTFGRGTVGIDLNAIPTSAIKRMEVLRDGASAQYGSDAIAGVINVELKDNIGTLDAVAMTGITGSGDGFQAKTGLNYGVPLGDKGGVLSLTAEFIQRNPTDRSGEWTGSFYPGVDDFDETTRMLEENGLSRDDVSMKIGQSQASVGMLFYNAKIPLDYAEAYSFGGLTYRDGEAAGFYRRPEQEDRSVLSVYPNGFLPEIHPTLFDWSAGGGIRTRDDHDGLGWDFSINHGGNAFDFRIENSINASLGEASPLEFDAGGFKFTQTTLNADLVKPIDTKAVQKLSVAGGAEYRVENYTINAGQVESFVLGPDVQSDGTPKAAGSQVFPGFQPDNEVDEYRSSSAAYLGVETEVNDKVLVDVGARFENYDDFGNTLNGKLAARVNVIEQLAVRAAVSNGFRAPSLHQVFFNNTSTQFVDNPDTGNLEARQVLTANNASDIAAEFGIPALTEETSVNASAGVTVTPIEGLSVTADGYFIRIDDRIVLTSRFSEGAVAGVGELLDPFGVSAAQFFSNAVDTETLGLDLVVDYGLKLSGATLQLTGAANFTRTEVTDVNIPDTLFQNLANVDDEAVRGVLFNNEEKNRLEDALPRQKGMLQARYNRDAISALVRANYYGPVSFTPVDDTLKEDFAGKVIFDLDLGYQLQSGFRLAIGANNLLNTFPDKQVNDGNIFNNQFIYSRRVTQFGINGGFYYLRLQYQR